MPFTDRGKTADEYVQVLKEDVDIRVSRDTRVDCNIPALIIGPEPVQK